MRYLLIGLALVGCGSSSNSGSHDAPSPQADAAADATVDAAVYAPSCPTTGAVDTTSQPELAVTGSTPTDGIFDPSIVYPAGAGAGAMAYSAVPDQMTIATHIAVSTDHGATWTEAATANAPEGMTMASTDATECPGGTCTGNLISEVSSLVMDPTDPDPNKLWKLFAHRYLVSAGVTLHYDLGTITLQTAPAPNGPWTAPQKWIGWNSSASYTSTGIVTNASSLTGTADCIALTEPGALVLPNSLELAVGCVYLDAGTAKIRVELLRSPDHATSWTSIGTLLHPGDADCLSPGASVNAPDLFVSGGVEYVVATPSTSTGYTGCLTYPIDDIANGGVRRDTNGRAVAIRTLSATPQTFSGACTFADGANGYTMDVGFLGDARPFRLFHTGVTTP